MADLIDDEPLLVIVEDGAPEAEWMEGRAEGVTASEIHAIATGSMKTWHRSLDDKLNGSTFHGNVHTRRGHELEPVIVAQARDVELVVSLAPSHALFGHPLHPLHRATPDGLGIHAARGPFGFEAKRREKTSRVDVPADHYDQCQFGMWVLGFEWWLYAWMVEGEDRIHCRWIARDEPRIVILAGQADDFIAWRRAGAPEINGLPDDIDDALADYARGLALAGEGSALKSDARARIDAWIAEQAPTDVLRREGSRAALTFTPKTAEVLDENAWSTAEPDTYQEWWTARERVAAQEKAAIVLYHRTVDATPGFRVTPNGAAA